MERPHSELKYYGADVDGVDVVIVAVHGRDQGAEFMIDKLARRVDPQDGAGHPIDLAWVLPEAPTRSWYPARYDAPLAENQIELDRALTAVDQSVRQALDSGVPSERIVLVGFSQGACVVLEYVARHPRRWGGVAALTGALMGPDGDERSFDGDLASTPMSFVSGDQDPWMATSAARVAARAFQHAGATTLVELHPSSRHTVGDAEVRAVQTMVEAVGRAGANISVRRVRESLLSSEVLSLPLPTTVMGSYPQPKWLIDHERLRGSGVPRVRAEDVWKVDSDDLEEAVEAATLVAIADQEEAGVDIITDGEIGRESYFNHFANSLGGVDRTKIGRGVNRRGGVAEVPLVNGPIVRTEPIELDAARFLRRHTDRSTKVTVPGPFTLSQLAENDFYADQRNLALAYARAVNEELHDLAAAGIDVVQIDEPYLQANPDAARQFAVEVISVAVAGIPCVTTLHTCYGYAAYVTEKTSGYPFLSELSDVPVDYIAIEAAQPDLAADIVTKLAPRRVVVGVLDLGDPEVEKPEQIAERIRDLLTHIDIADLSISPDCGMKYLPRATAKAKLRAMVEAAEMVRAERES